MDLQQLFACYGIPSSNKNASGIIAVNELHLQPKEQVPATSGTPMEAEKIKIVNLEDEKSAPTEAAVLQDDDHSSRSGKKVAKRTFADIIQGKSQSEQESGVPLIQTSPPQIEGGNLTVTIDEEEYCKGLDENKYNVIGKLSMKIRDPSLSTMELRSKLEAVWEFTNFKVIPVGQGFLHVFLRSYNDQSLVMSKGIINLKPGIFTVSQWVLDFNPKLQKQTNAQVWVRIFNLPIEYWRPTNLFNIARAAGLPLKIDKKTLDLENCIFARILVDVDLACTLPTKVLVKRKNLNFFVDIGFEKLPSFCVGCGIIEHSEEVCIKEPHRRNPGNLSNTTDIGGQNKGDDSHNKTKESREVRNYLNEGREAQAGRNSLEVPNKVQMGSGETSNQWVEIRNNKARYVESGLGARNNQQRRNKPTTKNSFEILAHQEEQVNEEENEAEHGIGSQMGQNGEQSQKERQTRAVEATEALSLPIQREDENVNKDIETNPSLEVQQNVVPANLVVEVQKEFEQGEETLEESLEVQVEEEEGSLSSSIKPNTRFKGSKTPCTFVRKRFKLKNKQVELDEIANISIPDGTTTQQARVTQEALFLMAQLDGEFSKELDKKVEYQHPEKLRTNVITNIKGSKSLFRLAQRIVTGVV